jgi:hypothetical protein
MEPATESSEAAQLRTVHLRWRGLVAALPALALLGGGLALAGSGAPAGPTRGAGASVTGGATLPVVPDTPFDMPGTANGAGGDAPGLDLPPTGPGFGPGSPVTLDSQGIPGPALAAYHRAAGVVGNADPACHIDWALIAAIGRVESDHGRYGGNALDAQGIARPGIYGIALDGRSGTAKIADTDNGVYDHDRVWDRAVGPMQFIPGTWRAVGGDLDGDGAKNPQDINDAAAATAIYLCAGPGNLSRFPDAYGAVRRYNNSDSYARTVLAIADAYRRGVTMLPLSDLPAASSNGGSSGPGAKPAPKPTKSTAAHGNGSGRTPTGAPTGGSGGNAAGNAGGSAGGSAGNPGGAVSSIVGGVTSALPPPPSLPGPVSSVVCPITTAGGGLGLPPLPLPLPGCPPPTPTPSR